MRLSLVARLAFAAATLAPSAFATDHYPRTISDHLGLSYTPACALCHLGGKSGAGTVVTPFGRAVRNRGLPEEDPKVLIAVIERMRGEQVDSDVDGVPDVDELVAGTDPNLPPNDSIGLERYGCVGKISPGRGVDGLGAFAAAALAIVLVRRRRGW